MLFCDAHLEMEFLKVEKRIKLIAIPFFTLISALFLTEYPFKSETHFWYHLISSFVGVLLIWFSNRAVINFIRRCFPKLEFGPRLSIQLVATALTSILLIYLLFFLDTRYLYAKSLHCEGYEFDLKNLLITTLLFSFLINTIYEGFYLFNKLSHIALETERYKKESIEAQYLNLTSRLNPHFLFNSMNTLSTLVEEDSKKAVEYIQELSVVYRYVLNTEKTTWTDLASEMRFTQSYINLLKMRFEKALDVNLDICDDHHAYFILPLTVQLLIENAVKHNEISELHPLDVSIYCYEDYLIVSNKKQKRNIIPSSTKVGLQNIKERYKFLANKDVFIDETEETFTVKIPLIKIPQNKFNNQ